MSIAKSLFLCWPYIANCDCLDSPHSGPSIVLAVTGEIEAISTWE